MAAVAVNSGPPSVAHSSEAAMSSGSIIMSGFVRPVGWQETVSAALGPTPMNMHHAELVAQGFLLEVRKPGVCGLLP